MNIQQPLRLNLDGDAVLREAVDRISHANKLSQCRTIFCVAHSHWAACRC